MRLAPALAVLLVAAATPLRSQDRQTVTLDVVDDGASRAPLTAADFSVTEGGQPLAVEAARLIQSEVDAPGSAASQSAGDSSTPRGRLIGIFVDEYHLSPGPGFEAVKAALVSFVRTRLGPDDQVLIVKPPQSLVSLMLTSDRESAAETIESAVPREKDYEPRSAFERDYIAGAPERIAVARSQIALSSIDALVACLGRFPSGRKTLIVMSDGFDLAPIVRGEFSRPNIEVVARAANRTRVAVYLFRPTAGQATGRSSDDRQRQTSDPLETLVRRTTGLAFEEPQDPSLALARVLRDASRYYLLTISPPAHPADGRFRVVDVRVTRPGVSLRARAGYALSRPDAARPDESASALPFGMRIPRRTSRMIRTWFGQAAGADGRTKVAFVWEPAPRVPGERSQGLMPARVSLVVTQMDGTPVFSGTVAPSAHEAFAGTTEQQLSFAAAPARLLAQMEVLDAAGQVLDRDVRDLVVNGFTGALAFGTPAVYRTRTAVEFRAVQSGDAPAPVAARQFSRTERLVVRMPVSSRDGGAMVTARLLSGFGAPLRDLAVTRLDGADDLRQVDVPLAPLASGRYQVEFSARDGDRTAVDRVDFTVTP